LANGFYKLSLVDNNTATSSHQKFDIQHKGKDKTSTLPENEHSPKIQGNLLTFIQCNEIVLYADTTFSICSSYKMQNALKSMGA